jgi:uncharacterized LabA/DUF88 family protein
MSQSLGRGVVLLDNGYLSAILRDEFASVRLDYLKFSETLCAGYHRLRTYVYDCLPYQASPPTEEQKMLYSGKQKFFQALQKLPAVEPRFGKQRPRGTGYIQKGVDVLLAVDLVRLSSKGQIQKAFLVAGDGDYVPAVKASKDEGVSVTMYHSGAFQADENGRLHPKYSNELWEACDDRRVIDKKLIEQCKF